MGKLVLVDEFHVSLRAPRDLQRVEFAALRRILNGPRFGAELRQAARLVARNYPALARVRVTVSR